MLTSVLPLVRVNLMVILRDRLLHAVMLAAAGMILVVPMLSTFSMQQAQELAITLSLSLISFVLLVTTLLLGTTSIFRDVERRYVGAVLSLPLSRAAYLLAKFASIVLFLAVSGAILAIGAAVVISLTAQQYPSEMAVPWIAILLAVAGDIIKYILLASVALLLSTVSTSFFLPFFGTLVIYLCGSASQEVFEFVSGEFGAKMHPYSQGAVKVVYFLLPNLSAFDFKVYAIYALQIPRESILFPLLYGPLCTAVFMGLAIWSFNRRQLA